MGILAPIGPPLPLNMDRQFRNITSPYDSTTESYGCLLGGKKLSVGSDRTSPTHPEVGDRQSFPKSRIDHVDQVLAVGGDEGAVVRRQTHGLGLLVTHAVGRVQPRHVARVGLVQRHQVELESQNRWRTSVPTRKSASTFHSACVSGNLHSLAERLN